MVNNGVTASIYDLAVNLEINARNQPYILIITAASFFVLKHSSSKSQHICLATSQPQVLTLFSVDRAESVVTQFIHETVKHCRRAVLIYSKLSLWCVIVCLLDMSAFWCGTTDTYHPQELVDVYVIINSRNRQTTEQRIITEQLVNPE